jgi:hypothetical protein
LKNSGEDETQTGNTKNSTSFCIIVYVFNIT